MSETIIVPSAAVYRARARLEQAEAIIENFSAAYGWIAALFTRVPAARDAHAVSIRRAWLRASA